LCPMGVVLERMKLYLDLDSGLFGLMEREEEEEEEEEESEVELASSTLQRNSNPLLRQNHSRRR
jgi:hypothetical protein